MSLTKGRADDAYAKLIDRFRNYRSELLKAWSIRHSEFNARQFAFMAGNEAQPAIAENAQDNEDAATNNDPANPENLRMPIIEITSRAALGKSSVLQKVLLHQTPI